MLPKFSAFPGVAGPANIAAATANLLGFERHPSWDESLLTVK